MSNEILDVNVIKLRTKKSSKELLDDFANAYAENGGDHVKAYIDAGFAPKTAAQNARKYLDKNHDYVMKVVKRVMGQGSALAQMLIVRAAQDENIPWGHRLKAIELMLKNSGVQKDTITIEDNRVEDMSAEEREAEILDLMQRLNAVNGG